MVRSLDKKFDATAEELSGLKRLINVIEVELQHADGREEEIIVDKGEFDKIVTDEVLQRADTVRGQLKSREHWRTGLSRL